MSKRKEKKEKPFNGMKVYFSNSIRGDIGSAKDIGIEVVGFMTKNGADVLSENVAYLKREESLPIFERKTGIDLTEVADPVERAKIIRKVDVGWVDEATHLVALANGASYGVGMEIQRALDKPKLGMNETPILCLVHKSCLDKLSSMIKGVDEENDAIHFNLRVYKDVDSAKEKISDFLLEDRKQN